MDTVDRLLETAPQHARGDVVAILGTDDAPFPIGLGGESPSGTRPRLVHAIGIVYHEADTTHMPRTIKHSDARIHESFFRNEEDEFVCFFYSFFVFPTL